MKKYILGVPSMVGHSDVVINYKSENDLEGLLVSISGNDTVSLATSSSVVIGVAQKKTLGTTSVGEGKMVPVILDDGAGSTLFGKLVYMTAAGKVTDVATSNTATPFVFSATQPAAGEVIKVDGTVVNGALIDTK